MIRSKPHKFKHVGSSSVAFQMKVPWISTESVFAVPPSTSLCNRCACLARFLAHFAHSDDDMGVGIIFDDVFFRSNLSPTDLMFGSWPYSHQLSRSGRWSSPEESKSSLIVFTRSSATLGFGTRAPQFWSLNRQDQRIGLVFPPVVPPFWILFSKFEL